MPPIEPIIASVLRTRPSTPEAELLQVMAWHEECGKMLAMQVAHPVFPEIPAPLVAAAFTEYADRAEALEAIIEARNLLTERAQAIELMRSDPYHHGWLADKADDFHWEVLRCRLANPRVPITANVWGGNGSGKSVLCAAIMARVCVDSQTIDSSRMIAWAFALNQKNSQEIQQANIYEWFPVEYRDPSGKPFKRNAAAGMTFSAGKFTDNEFKLPNGSKAEFRFYGDNSDMQRGLEGPRPFFVWSDEEIPQPWIESINNRLITMAGKTDAFIGKWKRMLEEKQANPSLKFPRDLWWQLYMGVHLISYTCKGGYTPAVRAMNTGATVVRSIEAELLPNKDGSGYEKVPELIRSASGNAFAMRFFAWENPWGGNWDGIKAALSGSPREKVLWMAYGVAEQTTDVVMTNWNRAAHVRPETRLPKHGTWYLICDPTDAKRNWFMKWYKIDTQQITFLAREWPQEDDHVPGFGLLGPWAVPSAGKRFDGDRGPAQKRVIHSFSDYAREIERVESEIEALEMRLHGHSDIKDRRRVRRIMDARFANTESMSHADSETAIEAMEKHGYYFEPSGKGGGGESNVRTIKERTGFVQDLLAYDATRVTLDEATGTYTFEGKAPLLYVCDRCTNTIFTMENWTNRDGGEGACKDPADCDGYYATCRPEHIDRSEQGFRGGEYF